MRNKDTFSSCHPVVNFLYFAMVLVFAMTVTHPVCLCLSLGSALAYAIYLKGKKGMKFTGRIILPLALLTIILNPAFSHEGSTILTYLPSGNPLTLESIYFGIGSAGMLIAVILWFSCYTEVMTADKFVYLFGKLIPALSLVLSMTLRFVPKFNSQIKVVTEAQKCVGRSVSDGGLIQRLKHGVTIFSIMVTWSLENAIETADSMKGRGYGLPGRTAFSIYRFDDRDKLLLAWLIFCGVFIGSGAIAGGMYWRYYPTTKGVEINVMTVLFQICYLAMCLTPVVINTAADVRWKKLMREEESSDR
ncbi:MAG: energy-coupling factor transporter transmembrane protein EcfT [Oscillospiraceae bacterium]|nr:energy-coupling factor transporter transmembrane protein EcfT [Oscillospiraceae bacterium]